MILDLYARLEKRTWLHLAWAPLLILILVLGVYPHLLFGATDPAVVNSLSECLDSTTSGACFDAAAGGK